LRCLKLARRKGRESWIRALFLHYAIHDLSQLGLQDGPRERRSGV